MAEVKVAKVVGLNSDAIATQALAVVGESPVSFFGIVGCVKDDAFSLARVALAQAEESFFLSQETHVSQRLQQTFAATEEFLKQAEQFQILLVALQDKALYVMAKGQELEVYLVRERNVTNILQIASAEQLISGYIQPGDRVILNTNSLHSVVANSADLIAWPIDTIKDEVESRLPEAHIDPVAVIIFELPKEEPTAIADVPTNLPTRRQQQFRGPSKQVFAGFGIGFKRFVPHIKPRIRLPRTRKGRLYAGVGLLLCVLVGIFFSIQQKKSTAITAEYQTYLSQAKVQFQQAQNVQDVDAVQAATALDSAKQNLQKALIVKPQGSDALALQRDINDNQARILKMYPTDSIPVWLDLDLVKTGMQAKALSLSVGKLLLLDTNQKSLVLIDTEKKSNQILTGGDKIGTPEFASLNGDFAFVYSADKGIIRVDAGSKEVSVVAKPESTFGAITDLYAFAGNLYMLDSQKGKIYKFLPTVSGYSEARDYLNADANLSGAERMQIDASVWVLKMDGELLKFTQGNRDQFSYAGLDKGVKDPRSFFVSSDTERVYLLDTGNKRLLVLDKSGNYISQYQSDLFASILDLAVDEQAKKAYLLDGQKIYTLGYNCLMKISNRKAFHEYHILDTLEAGIVLLGSEVKAIREGRIDLGDSFARVLGTELFLVNALIPPYHNAPIKDYDPRRTRKLLMHKNQIHSLIGQIGKGGMVLVPVSIYEKNNMIKVALGLGKSKRQVDKRKAIKERDNLRRIQQELRGKE
jgi:SsrA-binding protein